jgi:hypothetical protein
MQISRLFMAMLMSILLITSFACKSKPADREHEVISEGEEVGPRLAINDTYDTVRKGVRLILAYDSTSSSFIGTVENVTSKTIKSVRVEVHLSNGIELGPTKQIDLASGNKENVKLSAKGQSFNWWKAHPEAGEGEDDGENKREHEEEHENGENH